MEAWTAADKYLNALTQFTDKINQQIVQVGRNRESPLSQSLLTALDVALEYQFKHNDQKDQGFRAALRDVISRCILISSHEAVAESLSQQRIKLNPDNAILAEVLVYARNNPSVETVFLSANAKDFSKPAAVANIRYFVNTSAFLGWFGRHVGD